MKITKNTLKKAFRTFIQTACGYAVTNIALVCNGIDFTDGNAVLDVWGDSPTMAEPAENYN